MCLLLGSVSIVKKDLHSLRVQIFKLHMGDAMRLQVTVKDLKQVWTAAGQHSPMSHQLMTTYLHRLKGQRLIHLYNDTVAKVSPIYEITN